MYFLMIKIGDGIFDKLSDKEIFLKTWKLIDNFFFKKSSKISKFEYDYSTFSIFCGDVVDSIITHSLDRKSLDNLSLIFISFKNFERFFKNQFKNKSKKQLNYLGMENILDDIRCSDVTLKDDESEKNSLIFVEQFELKLKLIYSSLPKKSSNASNKNAKLPSFKLNY